MERFRLKTDVFFGSGSLNCLGALEGEKAFIVTDEMMIKLAFVDKVTQMLAEIGFSYKIFAEVLPDPDIKIVTKGLQEMTADLPDVILAIGGGSVIDTAKGVLYTYAKMNSQASVKIPKLVVIPTTSGTGSEVTSFSVITVNGEKLCLVDELMTPDYAILDPNFVKTVPPAVTAETGLDALSHALEAYVSTKATDFTDALVEKTVKLIFTYLIPVFRQGDDMVAREKVHNASCMAGIAFTNTSLGITHSIAHAIGGIFHLPHGRAIGVLLPHVIAFNANLAQGANGEAAEKYARLAEVIGLPAGSVEEGCRNFIRAIEVLLAELGVPANFSSYGISEEDYMSKLSTVASLAMADNCTATNPRQPNVENITDLTRIAY